jgi:hypothetical protein
MYQNQISYLNFFSDIHFNLIRTSSTSFLFAYSDIFLSGKPNKAGPILYAIPGGCGRISILNMIRQIAYLLVKILHNRFLDDLRKGTDI